MHHLAINWSLSAYLKQPCREFRGRPSRDRPQNETNQMSVLNDLLFDLALKRNEQVVRLDVLAALHCRCVACEYGIVLNAVL